ncbi:MAG: signal peptide peptidase SppA [Phycisphaerales bacterium]|nr:signal peptide peptidase SppA [Phycisphaerales bacterium]
MKRILAAVVVGVCALGASGIGSGQTTTMPAATQKAAVKQSKVGVIRLSQQLQERPASFQLSLSDLSGASMRAPVLSSLITTMNNAAKDNTLAGLFLDLSAFNLTLNQAQELGELMGNLRQSGKRIAVYASDFDTSTYVLASYADMVIMPENGSVLMPGVGLQMIFFKGTLDKLHLQPDFIQVGKFKGAEEPFMRTSASPEYKEQITKLTDGMYSQLVKAIAANRPKMTEEAVKKVIDEGWLSGKRAKELGIVDQLMTRDRVDAWVQSQFPGGVKLVEDYGKPAKKTINLDSPFAIFSLLSDSGGAKKQRGPSVAVIYACGQIMPDFGEGSEDSAEFVTPSGIRKAVDKAISDNLVKAIVLRVDSPGGSASASDEIWSVLKEADQKKPVTVSMGRVAASGGYYISCSGRSITADPATITGSIGVVGGKLVMKEALDKIGINIETVSRGKHATMLSAMQPFTDEEREFLKKSMEETYGVFSSRVMGARGKHIAKLEDVAQGRLFTGEQAKEAGLVDSVGTLHDVVLAAAKNAGIEKDYSILVLPEAKSFADMVREGLTGGDVSMKGLELNGMETMVQTLPPAVREQVRGAVRMMNILQSEGVLMGLPELVEVTR